MLSISSENFFEFIQARFKFITFFYRGTSSGVEVIFFVIIFWGCNVPRVKFKSSASSSGISVKTSGKRSNAKLPSLENI